MAQTGKDANSSTPTRTVPSARIEFLPEDRRWITDRIEEILESGQLTLGKYGAETEVRGRILSLAYYLESIQKCIVQGARRGVAHPR